MGVEEHEGVSSRAGEASHGLPSHVEAEGQLGWPQAFRMALPAALPVMIAYLSIGFPAGVMESMVGISPLMAFVISLTYYSGAGQFMVPKMVLAGQPLAAIASTVSFTNTRQILYSAAFSPYFARVGRPLSTFFAATVTDESFGVNLDRFLHDEAWCARAATATNVCCMLSWAGANLVGCALGPVINLPMALMSFAMTSIFICLAVTQPSNATVRIVMLVSSLMVLALKLVGLGNVAVLAGAVSGVIVGVMVGGEPSAATETDACDGGGE